MTPKVKNRAEVNRMPMKVITKYSNPFAAQGYLQKLFWGHQITEGGLIAWKELIKHLLNRNALGFCHYGLGLSPEARVEVAGEG